MNKNMNNNNESNVNSEPDKTVTSNSICVASNGNDDDTSHLEIVNLDEFSFSGVLDTSTPEKDESQDQEDELNELLQRAPKRKKVASPKKAIVKSKVGPTDVPVSNDQVFSRVPVPKEPQLGTTSNFGYSQQNGIQNQQSGSGTGNSNRAPTAATSNSSKLPKPPMPIVQSKVKETIVRQPRPPPPPNLNLPKSKPWSSSSPNLHNKVTKGPTSSSSNTGTGTSVNPISRTASATNLSRSKTNMNKNTKPKTGTSNAGTGGKSTMSSAGPVAVITKNKPSVAVSSKPKGPSAPAASVIGALKTKAKELSKNISMKHSTSTRSANINNNLPPKTKSSSASALPNINKQLNAQTHSQPQPDNKSSTSNSTSAPVTNFNSAPTSSTSSAAQFLDTNPSNSKMNEAPLLGAEPSSTTKTANEINHPPSITPVRKAPLSKLTSPAPGPSKLFRSQFWSYIDPKKYPPKESTEKPQENKEKPYDSHEVQNYIEKQKEMRKDKEKHEVELKQKLETKKKLQLVELDMKRRELVAKSKIIGKHVGVSSSSRIPWFQPRAPATSPSTSRTLKPPIPHQNLGGKVFPSPAKNTSQTQEKPIPNKIPIEEVDLRDNHLIQIHKPANPSVEEPEQDLRLQVLLQDFENIVHRDCLSVLRRRTEELERSVIANANALKNTTFQKKADKSVETTGSLCEDNRNLVGHGSKNKKNGVNVKKDALNLEKMNLAAAKIQAAFRSYKVRKIWREVRAAKYEKEQKLRKSSTITSSEFLAAALDQIPSRRFNSKSLTAFGLPLFQSTSTYIPPPPEFTLNLPKPTISTSRSSESNASTVSPSSSKIFDKYKLEAYPKEAIQRLQTQNTNNNNQNLRRKSLDFFNIEDLKKNRNSLPGTSNLNFLPTSPAPVPTFSTVLREKMRLLKEKSNITSPKNIIYETDYDSDSTQHKSIGFVGEDEFSSSSGATITDDYIGPGREAMQEAYNLRTGARLTFEPQPSQSHHNRRQSNLHKPQFEPLQFDSPVRKKPSSRFENKYFDSPRSTTTVETDDDLKSGTATSSSIDVDDYFSPIRKFQQVAERKRREVLEHALVAAMELSLGPSYETVIGPRDRKRKETIPEPQTESRSPSRSQKSTSTVTPSPTRKSTSPSQRSEISQEMVVQRRRQVFDRALKTASDLLSKSQLSDEHEQEEPSKDVDDTTTSRDANRNVEISDLVESYTQEFYSEKSDQRKARPILELKSIEKSNLKELEVEVEKITNVTTKPQDREQEVYIQSSKTSTPEQNVNQIEKEKEEVEFSVSNCVDQISEAESEPPSTSSWIPKVQELSSITSVSEKKSIFSQLKSEEKTKASSIVAEDSISEEESQSTSKEQIQIEKDDEIHESIIPIDSHISSEIQEALDDGSSKSDSFSQPMAVIVTEKSASESLSVKEKIVEQETPVIVNAEASIVEENSMSELEHHVSSVDELHQDQSIQEKSSTHLEPVSEDYSSSFLPDEPEIERDISVKEPKSQTQTEAQQPPSSLGPIDSSYSEAFSDPSVEISEINNSSSKKEENVELEHGSESEKDQDLLEIETLENDEIINLKNEATRIQEEQQRIEAEINELQGMNQEQSLTSPTASSENYFVPPEPLEIFGPAVLCPIAKFEMFIGGKVEYAWKCWKNKTEYSEQPIGLDDLEIFLPYVEESEETEARKQSFKEMLNDIVDDVIRETLHLEPEDQSVSLMDKVRPGLFVLELQKQQLPKTQDQLNSIVLNKVTKLISHSMHIADDHDESGIGDKPNSQSVYECTGRPKDRVDEVLGTELIEIEKQWRNVWPEEIIIKDELCDKLLKRTVNEVIEDLKRMGISLSMSLSPNTKT